MESQPKYGKQILLDNELVLGREIRSLCKAVQRTLGRMLLTNWLTEG